MSVSPAVDAWSVEGSAASDGRRVGVLLCHGFTGSPASVRPWGEHLAAEGYAVSVPRLPGHGTTWQDMNRTTWQQWYGEVERAFDSLLERCDSVVAGGLSMGATLSLLLAAERGPEVAGVMSVNVSIDNKDPRRFAAPVIKHLMGSFPGIADDIKKPGVTEQGYDRLPLKAAHELLKLYGHLRPAAAAGDPAPARRTFRGGPRRRPGVPRPPAARRCPPATSPRSRSRTATTSRRWTTTPRASRRSPRPSWSA